MTRWSDLKSQFKDDKVFVEASINPSGYGRYLVVHSNGTIHQEIWNGCGWSKHQDKIVFWILKRRKPLL